MKNLVSKYAIGLGESWFAGFRIGGGLVTVQKSVYDVRLLDEEELKLALSDLKKCDYVGEVFEVHMRKVGSKRFTR